MSTVYIETKNFYITDAPDGEILEKLSKFMDDPNNRTKMPPVFEVDELLAPVISLLNRKGFYTRFSCSGHYIEACWQDGPDSPERFSTIANEPYWLADTCYLITSGTPPYISFSIQGSKNIVKYMKTLPIEWEAEYYPINPDKMLFDHDSRSKKLPKDKSIPYIIRLGVNYDVVDPYENKSSDPYLVYHTLVEIHHSLYRWVKSLKPKKYSIEWKEMNNEGQIEIEDYINFIDITKLEKNNIKEED